jgi:hypothetical protein
MADLLTDDAIRSEEHGRHSGDEGEDAHDCEDDGTDILLAGAAYDPATYLLWRNQSFITMYVHYTLSLLLVFIILSPDLFFLSRITSLVYRCRMCTEGESTRDGNGGA